MCGRLMSPAHETQSMREIRLLRGRLPRKGGGLTGMGKHDMWLARGLTTYKYEKAHLDKNLHQFFFLFNPFRFVFKSIPQPQVTVYLTF